MTAPTMRRAPRQARSQQKIEDILDAAEAVLSQEGHGGFTTNAIAARAQISIGSLYQFFPNKEAIVAALAGRLLEDMRVCRDTLFVPEAAALPVGEWLDQVVDRLAHTNAANPSFKSIVCDPAFSPEMAEAEAVLQREILDGVSRVCAAWRPDLPEDRCRLYAAFGVEVTKALLPVAAAGPEPEFALGELKALLRAYFEPIFGTNATR
ncbi:MAG TPA: TetR/AcrR family transcriptional regulator [Chloroflexota bacterium]|jgi:AcrR family transcriptional regulator